MVIFLSVYHFILTAFTGYLSFKVYSLVKTKDLPLFLSILSIFASLLCNISSLDSLIVMLVWIIAFLVFIHPPYDNLLHTTNFLKSLNFTAIMCLVFALIFDLYKWYFILITRFRSSFLIATNKVVNRNRELYFKRLRFLERLVFTIQVILLTAAIVINVLLFAIEKVQLSDSVVEHGLTVSNTTFYMSITLLTIINFLLCIVDCKLIKRLRKSYPYFYRKQKNKVKVLLSLYPIDNMRQH